MMKPSPGEMIADKYRLVSVLGEGGTSTVFAAENVLTGKPVAIKWLLPELTHDDEVTQRMLREAQVTSSIDHPNVVNLFDLGRHQGALFLVMELLRGERLSDLLAREPQDPYEFVKLMLPVLRGVQAAHQAGVVHRDLKPDNIFLCVDAHGQPREPKVLDFGISKLTGVTLTPGQELTRAGTIFGTPQYMAPEQMRDARAVDERSDIYALGAIFYHAISGVYPYDGETLTELAIRIVEGNAQPLHERVPQLDKALSEVVMRALSLDPKERFQSVAELSLALEPFAHGPLLSGLARLDRQPEPVRESALPARNAPPPAGPPPPPPPRASQRPSRVPAQLRALPRMSVPPPPPPEALRGDARTRALATASGLASSRWVQLLSVMVLVCMALLALYAITAPE